MRKGGGMTFHKFATLAWSAVVALVLLSLGVRVWVGGTGETLFNSTAWPRPDAPAPAQ
jgi:hypothetical protein